MRHLLCFIILLIFSVSNLSSQAIKEIGRNQFEYQGQVFEFKDMDHIFSQSMEAHETYMKANRKFNTAKRLRNATFLSFGAGMFLAAAEGECSFDDGQGNCIPRAIGAGIIIIGTLPLGIASIITKSSGKKNQRLSIDLYNEEYGIKLPRENSIEFDFVLNNGFGIQMRF